MSTDRKPSPILVHGSAAPLLRRSPDCLRNLVPRTVGFPGNHPEDDARRILGSRDYDTQPDALQGFGQGEIA